MTGEMQRAAVYHIVFNVQQSSLYSKSRQNESYFSVYQEPVRRSFKWCFVSSSESLCAKRTFLGSFTCRIIIRHERCRFSHHENPPTWAGVAPATLGAEGQRQTNHSTQSAIKFLPTR
ncbi:hypothetical protein TNCV_4995871 [Trichonephila clavipes]|nr:hypothetical protein TNCV_4995871 [Trichonephila clavipes]